ncbi:MAG: cation:proton antiporter [Candidatus Calescibacterium sp.]|jgi:Kef-type K+ transport system membrane component KefB|nr:cation:proton antiporter [Candidatus Calescibacterium sp.]
MAEQLWWEASIWILLALASSLLSLKIGISVALVEIIVGIIAGNTIHPNITPWVKFLSSFGAVILTFLAGAELERDVIKKYWKESLILGLIGFFAPFIGAWLIAQFILGWELKQAQLAGIALSTTSVAVVYAVMVETGLNEKPLGKIILAACFVNDLGTVIALGLLFTKINITLIIFTVATILAIIILPKFSEIYFRVVKNHPSEPEVKFIFLTLSLFGLFAVKSGSEAVLPAYLIGAALANLFLENRELVKRMRATTIAILTPFYFLKAGSLVNLQAILTQIGALTVLFFAKVISKFVGLYPAGVAFRFRTKVNLYNVMLMSTGLTFGTISALYGLEHNIIDQNQYSLLVTVVILSAIIPTYIAQKFFYPKDEEASNFKIERKKKKIK